MTRPKALGKKPPKGKNFHPRPDQTEHFRQALIEAADVLQQFLDAEKNCDNGCWKEPTSQLVKMMRVSAGEKG